LKRLTNHTHNFRLVVFSEACFYNADDHIAGDHVWASTSRAPPGWETPDLCKFISCSILNWTGITFEPIALVSPTLDADSTAKKLYSFMPKAGLINHNATTVINSQKVQVSAFKDWSRSVSHDIGTLSGGGTSVEHYLQVFRFLSSDSGSYGRDEAEAFTTFGPNGAGRFNGGNYRPSNVIGIPDRFATGEYNRFSLHPGSRLWLRTEASSLHSVKAFEKPGLGNLDVLDDGFIDQPGSRFIVPAADIAAATISQELFGIDHFAWTAPDTVGLKGSFVDQPGSAALAAAAVAVLQELAGIFHLALAGPDKTVQHTVPEHQAHKGYHRMTTGLCPVA
jgi:hypothetical protein